MRWRASSAGEKGGLEAWYEDWRTREGSMSGNSEVFDRPSLRPRCPDLRRSRWDAYLLSLLSLIWRRQHLKAHTRAKAVAKFGCIDLLVANAAIIGRLPP